MEEGKEENRRCEGEVCGGSENDAGDGIALLVEEEQECGGDRDCAGDWPGGFVVEDGEDEA